MVLATAGEARCTSGKLDVLNRSVSKRGIDDQRLSAMLLDPLNECLRVAGDRCGRRIRNVFEDCVKYRVGRLR
jgi:hypothetical protein